MKFRVKTRLALVPACNDKNGGTGKQSSCGNNLGRSGLSLQEKLASGQALSLYAFLFWWFSSALQHCTKAGQSRLGHSGDPSGASWRGAGGLDGDLNNDVYFQVALLTTIGLSRKTPF